MRRFVLLVAGLALLAGVAATVSGGATRAEARWVITDLGTLGGSQSEATAINECGQIVGWAETKEYGVEAPRHTFLWENGTMTDLGLGVDEQLGRWGRSQHVWINERGQILVNSSPGSAYIWDDGQVRELSPPRPEWWVRGMGINDRGAVAGIATRPGAARSEALALNARSEVVGWAVTRTDT
jgi:probable HAF family extracellular repeat protein